MTSFQYCWHQLKDTLVIFSIAGLKQTLNNYRKDHDVLIISSSEAQGLLGHSTLHYQLETVHYTERNIYLDSNTHFGSTNFLVFKSKIICFKQMKLLTDLIKQNSTQSFCLKQYKILYWRFGENKIHPCNTKIQSNKGPQTSAYAWLIWIRKNICSCLVQKMAHLPSHGGDSSRSP